MIQGVAGPQKIESTVIDYKEQARVAGAIGHDPEWVMDWQSLGMDSMRLKECVGVSCVSLTLTDICDQLSNSWEGVSVSLKDLLLTPELESRKEPVAE